MSQETREQLLPGSDDEEILASFSPFDKQHTALKACHIVDLLCLLVEDNINQTPTTWLECYENAREKNFNTIKQSSTIAD